VWLLYVDADRAFEDPEQIEAPIIVNEVTDEIILDARVRGGDEEMNEQSGSGYS